MLFGGPGQAYSIWGPSQSYIFFFCQSQEMNIAIDSAIVEIVGPPAAIAFQPFLRVLGQESIQVRGLAKNGRGNTLQKHWLREHSPNEQVSGAWRYATQPDNKCTSWTERAHYDGSLSQSSRPEDIILSTALQWSISSDCSSSLAQLYHRPVKPLATHKHVVLQLTDCGKAIVSLYLIQTTMRQLPLS